MSKLRVFNDVAGCLYCIAETAIDTRPESLTYHDKTPNKAMVKDGIYRYPFRSTRVDINAKPRFEASERVGRFQWNRSDIDEYFMNITGFGTQGEAYVIGDGGLACLNRRDPKSPPYNLTAYWLKDCGEYSVYMYIGHWFFNSGNTQCTYIRHSDYASYTIWPFPDSLTPWETLGRIMGGSVPPADPDRFGQISSGYYLSVTRLPTHIPCSIVDNLCDIASSACCVDEHVMSTEIINDLRVTDVNIPAFFSELPKFGQTIPDICNNIKNMTTSKSFTEASAAAASANLAYQYGDRLSISDAEALLKAGREASATCEMFGPRWARNASSASYAGTGLKAEKIVRYSVQASPADALSKGIYGLANIFNSQNVWDMIPYSFVLDWFVNISDVAAASDAKVLSSTLTYDHIYRSETLVLDLNDYNADGTFLSGRIVRYSRDRKYEMPEPDAKLTASIPNATQWLNGGSLLAQTRLKK